MIDVIGCNARTRSRTREGLDSVSPVSGNVRRWSTEGIEVSVYDHARDAGEAAAAQVVAAISRAVQARGKARVIFASAPSQSAMLAALVAHPDVPWPHVEALHMDEYVGLDPDAPQSFGQWLAQRLAATGVGRLELIRPGDDPEGEARRYGDLVTAEPVDVTCLGIGINAHIAFNEPGRCRFDDPQPARVVELTEASRAQQVQDECFGSIDDVPRTAVTLTIPTLLRAGTLVVTVPGAHKAPAVEAMLTKPIGPACPATALRGQRSARLYLDSAAAAQL
jgi:glucosamine-6-phosphate deaminase